jgi:DNA polymerase-3 subunit beta
LFGSDDSRNFKQAAFSGQSSQASAHKERPNNMKATCDREKLLWAFQLGAMVAPSRSPKAILQNVKLEVGQPGAILMATDMELGVRCQVEGIDVESPGAAVLPVDRFGPILRETTDEKLHLESDPQGTLVRGERSEFKLPGINPDEFPAVAEFSEEKYVELSAALLRLLIERTIFATDTESSRYALGGVLLEIDGKTITAVGTDGRRLAKMQGPATAVGGYESGESMTIVPTRALQLLERALGDAEGDIQLAPRPNDVLVKTPQVTVFSRLVEGRFPKWREVLPRRQESIKIELTVGPVYAAVRQAAIVASEESRGIDMTFADGSLVMVGQTAEVGQSRIELPIPYDGEPIDITLDHRFLGDFLRVLDGEKSFTLDVKDAEEAALCVTDDGYGYVVMPLARDR